MMLGGRYELRHQTGGHGSVRVFKALDTATGKPVLIKLMPAGGEDLASFIQFQEEGVVLTSLDHPNIWRVYGTFVDGEIGGIVLEPVEGLPLAEVLAEGQLSLRRIKLFALQMVAGLAYAHDRGVMHRNLNVENIVVMPEDLIKVRDMSELGTTRLIRAGTARPSTSAAVSPYMAPEQRAGMPVDVRTDVYSVGAIVYHMIMGEPPIDGPRRWREDVPHEWQALVARALAADKRYRFPTLRAMGEALEAAPPLDVRLTPISTPPVGIRCPQCGRPGRGQFCTACGTRLPDQ
jgi:serine/threonine protein kinase